MTKEIIETWRPVVGFEGRYSVSDLGNVVSHVSRFKDNDWFVMRPWISRYGYPRVSLMVSKRNRVYKTVHVLVAEAFIGPRKHGYQVNHKNGIKTDNRSCNLEYVTCRENVLHSIETLGHSRTGENNPAAKLTEKKVIEIRERRAAGEFYSSIGRAFGITSVMARKIATGKNWKNIGGPISGTGRTFKMTLTDNQVATIRKRFKQGERAVDLASEYGVSIVTIYNYSQGKRRNPKK